MRIRTNLPESELNDRHFGTIYLSFNFPLNNGLLAISTCFFVGNAKPHVTYF
jgi:hypothetical protein